MFNYLLFSLINLYIFFWTIINLSLSSLGSKSAHVTIVEDDNITSFVAQKCYLVIKKIKIAESLKLFGMMIGIPGFPQLILSRKLYETFDKDELEYVLLHESGHYILKHGIKDFFWVISLNLIGIFVLSFVPNSLVAFIASITLGTVTGIMLIQIGRRHEVEADTYAVKLMDNPQGMIDATHQFQNFYGKRYSEHNNKFIQYLFYRGNPYENRIRIAKTEIRRRAILQ